MNKKVTGVAMALAVAALFASGKVPAADSHTEEGKIKCTGINSCKGKGDCGTKNRNDCKGANTCKAKGWVYVDSEKDCADNGGTVVKNR